jgi:hypothetical protein
MTEPAAARFSIGDLAQQSGTKVETIRYYVSAQLTAHSKFRRDGAGMVSTMNEVDTIDERSLKPIETGSCRRVAERPAPL